MTAVRPRVVVLGGAPAARAAVAALSRREGVDVAAGTDALTGARVVVAAGGAPWDELVLRAPGAVVVVVGDGAAVDAALDATLLPRGRVLGTGGIAATARWRALVARAAGVSARDVTGLVLGGAGSAGVPVLTTVAGAPAAAVLGEAALERLAEELRDRPEDEHDAAWAVAEVAGAVLDDARRVLPCALRCHGELGIGGAAVAVPVVVGAAGAEAVLELPLAGADREAVGRASARAAA